MKNLCIRLVHSVKSSKLPCVNLSRIDDDPRSNTFKVYTCGPSKEGINANPEFLYVTWYDFYRFSYGNIRTVTEKKTEKERVDTREIVFTDFAVY